MKVAYLAPLAAIALLASASAPARADVMTCKPPLPFLIGWMCSGPDMSSGGGGSLGTTDYVNAKPISVPDDPTNCPGHGNGGHPGVGAPPHGGGDDHGHHGGHGDHGGNHCGGNCGQGGGNGGGNGTGNEGNGQGPGGNNGHGGLGGGHGGLNGNKPN